MDLIGPELFELSALFRKFAIFDFVYTLANANIAQSVQTWPQYIYPYNRTRTV